MSGTRYSGTKPALTNRDNEFFGDLIAWNRAHGEDNSEQLERLRHNLRLVRQRELTPRQAEVIRLRYEGNLSVEAIARELGVGKSTVSRTLKRGKQRLRKYLQYSL